MDKIYFRREGYEGKVFSVEPRMWATILAVTHDQVMPGTSYSSGITLGENGMPVFQFNALVELGTTELEHDGEYYQRMLATMSNDFIVTMLTKKELQTLKLR